MAPDLPSLLERLTLLAESADGRLAAEKLNAPITETEVHAALQRMRAGAAAGLDGVRTEWVRCLWYYTSVGRMRMRRFVLTDVLCVLLNAVLQSPAGAPGSWMESYVVSVPKQSPITDVTQHRPIAVGTVYGKLLSMVLEARLTAFSNEQNLRAEGQAGFRQGRGTAEQIFIMSHIIDKYRLGWDGARGRHLYAAFIDFRQAYDSVRRDLLMDRLAEAGVHGCYARTLASMYWQVLIRARVQGEDGEAFRSTVGVRQGDPYPPCCSVSSLTRWSGGYGTAAPGRGWTWGTGGVGCPNYCMQMTSCSWRTIRYSYSRCWTNWHASAVSGR